MIDNLVGDDLVHWKDDPRSVDELMMTALTEVDEFLAWDAVSALHWRGTREVMDRARSLCKSVCSFERRVGADIIGQASLPNVHSSDECLQTLLGMLATERDEEVLPYVLFALSHLKRPESIIPASLLQNHRNPDVRYGIVHALMGYEDEQAIRILIRLTKDAEAHVRDWATFALGSQIKVDTPELRQALVERMTDEDGDTRVEAMVGLAQRKDHRVLPAIKKELASDCVGRTVVEAAALIGDPKLHPLLINLQSWWDLDADLLREAIQACSPPKP